MFSFKELVVALFLDAAGFHKSKSVFSPGSIVHNIAMDPQRVARAGFIALFRKKRRVFPGISNKLHYIFIYLIHTRLTLAVCNFFMKRYRKGV